MDYFVGTKAITAVTMTRGVYNTYRGWDLPADEDGDDMGYLVEYAPDPSSPPNHDHHEGYISWSPEGVFNEFYKPSGQMSFGHALVVMKAGGRVSREGWNGKAMWLVYVEGSFVPNLNPNSPYAKAGLENVTINPHIDMMTATGEMQPGWLASQTDMLADDWGIVSDA
jgi:hypothetical protein